MKSLLGLKFWLWFLMAFGYNYEKKFGAGGMGNLIFKSNSRLWPKYVAQDIGKKLNPLEARALISLHV